MDIIWSCETLIAKDLGIGSQTNLQGFKIDTKTYLFVNDMHIMIHKMHLDYLVSHELILFFSLQENSLTSEGWVTRLSAYLLPMISTKHLGRVLLNFSYILCSKPLAHPFSTLPMCLMNVVNDKLVGCCAWKLACMATQMTIFNL